MFEGILIEKKEDKQSVRIAKLNEADLPEGDVLVDVAWTTLNYKDALAITGKAPIVRQFPMVPGIDFSGTVVESQNKSFSPGDRVIMTGWGMGEKHWGGMSKRARVKGEWLVSLPEQLDLRQAMAIGTAGFTAMLCVMALEENGVTPDCGEILVTGAAGGVGSVATALLSSRGYQVAAVTGRTSETSYLAKLGASQIVDRETLTTPGKPLARESWAGAIDVVGGTVLANVLAAIKYGGTVAACGLAGGMSLPTTVAPFILRGVTLAGVDSVMCDRLKRVIAWDRLAQELDPTKLNRMISEIDLRDVTSMSSDMLKGRTRGRKLVSVS